MTTLAERLEALLPKPGLPPPRATEFPHERRVLQFHLQNTRDSQRSMALAFEALAGSPENHRRLRIGQDSFAKLIETVKEFRPSLVFAQVQHPWIAQEYVEELNKAAKEIDDCVTIFWSGDVAQYNIPCHNRWYIDYGKELSLILQQSLFHARALRRGVYLEDGQWEAPGAPNAAYLQTAHDDTVYFQGTSEEWGRQHDVVFLFNSYGQRLRQSIRPWITDHREQLATAFQKAFPRRSHIGGGVASDHAGPLLRQTKLVLSCSCTDVFDRHTSCRLFKAMACGACVLVKRFADCESFGFRHQENCLLFDTVEEALELAHWALAHEDDARAIGTAGAALVAAEHTWRVRMMELAPLVEAVRADRAT